MAQTFFSRYKYPFIVIVFIALFIVVIQHGKQPVPNIPYVVVGGQKIEVELAVSQEEQLHGLSNRDMLEPTRGMLFVFEKPGKYNFWMQGMNFNIDMIWISEDMKIVYIKKNADHTKPFDQYGPSVDAKYVLEVVAGFSDMHKVKEGDVIQFSQ